MIKHLIGRGIGFNPGGPKYIITAGLEIGIPVVILARLRTLLGVGN